MSTCCYYDDYWNVHSKISVEYLIKNTFVDIIVI